jgi:formylglycine-generating enzyme
MPVTVAEESIGRRFRVEGTSPVLIPTLLGLVLAACSGITDSKDGKAGRMALIPSAGKSFIQGEQSVGQAKQRPVTLTRSFFMDRHEVTRELYSEVMGIAVGEYSLQYPKSKVSWYDAVLFCNRRSKLENLDTAYSYSGDTTICEIPQSNDCYSPARIPKDIEIDFGSDEYRLPTLAEWEFACKGGRTTAFYWGNAEADFRDFEWAKEGATATESAPLHPVGMKKPNPFGLYDIMGNAREWANDNGFDSSDSIPATDPVIYSKNSLYHHTTGVNTPRNDLHFSDFGWAPSTSRVWRDTGFRCVRTVKD